jgi:DNA-binding MarR family transcriptional regulator
MRERTRLRLLPAVHRAAHRLGLYLQAVRPALAVSQGEAHVLAHLAEASACPIGELARAFAHRRSTLTSILDRLEARGLVRRSLRAEDRRSFRVSLTPAGRALARRVHASLGRLEADLGRRLGRPRLEETAEALAVLQEAARGRP